MKLQAFCFSAAISLGLGAVMLPAAAAVTDAHRDGLANFDTFRSESAHRDFAPPAGLDGRSAKTIFDRQLGKATFLWAKPDVAPLAVGPLANTRDILIERARSHLRNEGRLLGLTEEMIAGAEIYDAQYNGKGPAVVRFRQRINGIEVFGRSLNVILDRVGKPIAVSGHFATDLDAASLAGPAFVRSASQAIAAGVGNLGLGRVPDSQLIEPLDKALDALPGSFQWFKAPPLNGGKQVWERMPRAKAVYYPREGHLQPAYYLEMATVDRDSRAISGYGLVVSGLDSTVLHRRNLVSKAAPFTYTVFADGADNNFHPWDSPLGNGYTPFPGVSPEEKLARVSPVAAAPKVTLTAAFGLEDPWLADDATSTVGNNVNACIDTYGVPLDVLAILIGVPIDQIIAPLNSCVALFGDITPETTSAGTFDYALAPDEDPSHDNAKRAAAVSLFFINNWLHDAWYVHGFNEEAGNAQEDNYGRGGRARDPIKAQGQDVSGRNNANMYTPADGSSPTMQQYLFDGPINGYVRQVSPGTQDYVFSVGDFTPTEFDVLDTKLVLAADTDGEPTDGCDASEKAAPAQASLAGAVALVYRGSCPFSEKVNFAQDSGAVAIIIVNNVEGAPISMALAEGNTIPSVMIKKADGDALNALLVAGTEVKMSMHREPSPDIDGTLDNQIVAHEFFHYVHHRLTDSSSQQTGGMSEGWGDIDALILSVRPDDVLTPGNDKWQGVYAAAGYVINNFYYGIRRAPYSTDFSKNAYTFKHISDGTATPDGSDGASNSEVHNAGEIWANMVWECYAGLLNYYPFAEAQQRIKDIIIGGLKGTPTDATYTEARDALLAAAKGNENGEAVDYLICGNAFAKRGAGPAAVSPPRDSTDLVGVTEDFTPYGTAPTPPVVPPTEPPVVPPTAPPQAEGRFGGGALNLLLLLPLLTLGLLRRRRRAV